MTDEDILKAEEMFTVHVDSRNKVDFKEFLDMKIIYEDEIRKYKNIIKEIRKLREHLSITYYDMGIETNAEEMINRLDNILVKENK